MNLLSWSIFRNRRIIWFLFLLISLAVVFVWPFVHKAYRTPEVLIAVMTSIWGAAYFFYRTHADDARFMKELMQYFNDKYDRNNNDLAKILRNEAGFSQEDENAFINYFNLCAEEWIFYRAGYVYSEVWSSWENGMRQYASDSRVKELWAQEKETDSYYKFEFPVSI